MKKRILIVDDEASLRDMLSVTLQAKGYEVFTAANGQEGLEKVENARPNLIVLDVMMPIMDGYDCLKALQADPKYRDIPVIMLTAKAQDADVFKGWASGVSSYLTKPFNPRELLIFVERIFQAIDSGEATGEWQENEQGGIVYDVT